MAWLVPAATAQTGPTQQEVDDAEARRDALEQELAGMNAELQIDPAGAYTIVVLSNYDPDAAGAVAQKARELVARLSRTSLDPAHAVDGQVKLVAALIDQDEEIVAHPIHPKF